MGGLTHSRWPNVRCGSKADFGPGLRPFRFALNNRHSSARMLIVPSLDIAVPPHRSSGSFANRRGVRATATLEEIWCEKIRGCSCRARQNVRYAARSGQRCGVAGVAAGCWVAGGAAAGAAAGRDAAGAVAGRTRGSQRPFTMRIFRALHLRTAARTLAFDTQMPSTS